LKICSICGEEKNDKEFNRNGNHIRKDCKACNYISKERSQALRRAEKYAWVRGFKSKGCQVCGESRIHCLDLHHMDPTDKEYQIAKICSGGANIKTLIREASKCIVLCANCHRDLHFNERSPGL